MFTLPKRRHIRHTLHPAMLTSCCGCCLIAFDNLRITRCLRGAWGNHKFPLFFILPTTAFMSPSPNGLRCRFESSAGSRRDRELRKKEARRRKVDVQRDAGHYSRPNEALFASISTRFISSTLCLLRCTTLHLSHWLHPQSETLE